MEDLELYGPPNPALVAILNGNQLRGILLAEVQGWKSLYIGMVDRGDDPRPEDIQLFRAAHAFTERQPGMYGTRHVGVLEVRSDHALPHNFGWETERDQFVAAENDLNTILGMVAV